MGMIHKFQSNILFRVWVEFMLSFVRSGKSHPIPFMFLVHLFEVASSFWLIWRCNFIIYFLKSWNFLLHFIIIIIYLYFILGLKIEWIEFLKASLIQPHRAHQQKFLVYLQRKFPSTKGGTFQQAKGLVFWLFGFSEIIWLFSCDTWWVCAGYHRKKSKYFIFWGASG
jgi:hypothetical protein